MAGPSKQLAKFSGQLSEGETTAQQAFSAFMKGDRAFGTGFRIQIYAHASRSFSSTPYVARADHRRGAGTTTAPALRAQSSIPYPRDNERGTYFSARDILVDLQRGYAVSPQDTGVI